MKKTHNTLVLMTLAFSLLIMASFSSCEKDEIETIPLGAVTADMLETVNYGSKSFFLNFSTDLKTYPVTYIIRNETNINGNQINVQLLDIQKDGLDDLNIEEGSASCAIDLGTLNNGIYNLEVKVGETNNSGTLNISEDYILLDFPSSTNLSVGHDTLNRIPFGTVWGYLGYQNANNASYASDFINDLETIGGEPLTLQAGYYGHFAIIDSNTFVQPIDEGFTYYKEFAKNYVGTADALNEHIQYYVTEHYNKVDLIIYWFYDGSKNSAMTLPEVYPKNNLPQERIH